MKILFVLNLVLFALASIAYADDDKNFEFTGKHYFISYELRENDQIISLHGNILSGLVEDLSGFNRVKKLIRPGVDVQLKLNSGGGFQAEVDTMFKAIKEACYEAKYSNRDRGSNIRRRILGWENKRCNITSIVRSGSICASACIPLFMVGDVRQASFSALFGFHQAAVAPGFLQIPFMAEGDLKKRGVDVDWLKDHSRLFQSLEITWLLPYEMENSNIVTDVRP